MQKKSFAHLYGADYVSQSAFICPQLNLLTRFFTALVVALVTNQLIALSCLAYDRDENGTPVFFVSKNAPPGGDGSREHPWNELDRIDWTTVQAASDDNQPGQLHPPTSNFTGLPWTVDVQVDGGTPTGFMRYTTPLEPRIANNPYINYAVVRRQPGTGQVIIDGSQDTSGKPGIDFSHQSGLYVIGNSEIGWGGPAPGMLGIAVTGWPVGVYVGSGGYCYLDSTFIAHNGVGIMAAGRDDMPSLTVGGRTLNVNTQQYYDLGYVAGAGLHVRGCYIRDNYDPTYRAQAWIANSMYNRHPLNTALPEGYPAFYSTLICDTAHPGQTDGIVYNNAINQSQGPKWYQVDNSIIGSGLRNGLVISQSGTAVSALGDLFINPYHAAVTKSHDSQVIYMANCASVMTRLNANSDATVVVQGPESPWDRVGSCSIHSGAVEVDGDRVLSDGNAIDQTNTEGNTVILSPNMSANRFTTDPSTLPTNLPPTTWLSLDFSLPQAHYPPTSDDAAAYQVPNYYPGTYINPPTSAAVTLGLAPNSQIPSGYAPGFTPGGGGGHEPSLRPVQPPNQVERPSVRPVRPPNQVERPSVRPVRPPNQVERPSLRPVQPPNPPGEPSLRPVQPPNPPGEPSLRPVQPPNPPGEPSLRPVQPDNSPGDLSLQPVQPDNSLGKPLLQPMQLQPSPYIQSPLQPILELPTSKQPKPSHGKTKI